ncbi:MAG: hypothetical protein ACHREM_00265 [Polyangiales bacterium]
MDTNDKPPTTPDNVVPIGLLRERRDAAHHSAIALQAQIDDMTRQLAEAERSRDALRWQITQEEARAKAAEGNATNLAFKATALQQRGERLAAALDDVERILVTGNLLDEGEEPAMAVQRLWHELVDAKHALRKTAAASARDLDPQAAEGLTTGLMGGVQNVGTSPVVGGVQNIGTSPPMFGYAPADARATGFLPDRLPTLTSGDMSGKADVPSVITAPPRLDRDVVYSVDNVKPPNANDEKNLRLSTFEPVAPPVIGSDERWRRALYNLYWGAVSASKHVKHFEVVAAHFRLLALAATGDDAWLGESCEGVR